MSRGQAQIELFLARGASAEKDAGSSLRQSPRRMGRWVYSSTCTLALVLAWLVVDGAAKNAHEILVNRRAAWVAYHDLANRAGALHQLDSDQLRRERIAVEEDYTQLLRVWRAAQPATGFEPTWQSSAAGRCLTLGRVAVTEVAQ